MHHSLKRFAASFGGGEAAEGIGIERSVVVAEKFLIAEKDAIVKDVCCC